MSQLCAAVTRLLKIPVSITALSGTVRLGVYFPVCIGGMEEAVRNKATRVRNEVPKQLMS